MRLRGFCDGGSVRSPKAEAGPAARLPVPERLTGISVQGGAMHLLPRSRPGEPTAGDIRPFGSPSPVGAEYWLHHCDGFRVDGPDGRVGVVDHVELGLEADVPDVVAVASGLWRIRLTRIPLRHVVAVEPGRRRLVVRKVVAER
jgi:hypothetical protein